MVNVLGSDSISYKDDSSLENLQVKIKEKDKEMEDLRREIDRVITTNYLKKLTKWYFKL